MRIISRQTGDNFVVSSEPNDVKNDVLGRILYDLIGCLKGFHLGSNGISIACFAHTVRIPLGLSLHLEATDSPMYFFP